MPSNNVNFHIDFCANMQITQRSHSESMGHNINPENIAFNTINGQAHTVNTN